MIEYKRWIDSIVEKPIDFDWIGAGDLYRQHIDWSRSLLDFARTRPDCPQCLHMFLAILGHVEQPWGGERPCCHVGPVASCMEGHLFQSIPCSWTKLDQLFLVPDTNTSWQVALLYHADGQQEVGKWGKAGGGALEVNQTWNAVCNSLLWNAAPFKWHG